MLPSPVGVTSIQEIGKDAPQTALFCNVHMLMMSRNDSDLRGAMEKSALVFADGVPIAWLQSRLAGRKAGVVTGSETMTALCEYAARARKRVGLFGSTAAVISALSNRLQRDSPGLIIAYAHAPGFMAPELLTSESELDAIVSARLDYLFVGLGCPKQEKWIHRYAGALNCSVLGVGAAFDWLAGTAPMPPRWMARSGLGWLYRLARDPKRLWKRYLVYNTAFLLAAAEALVRHRFAPDTREE
jgi:N-acetylglucosaminyldiphosphoundecaprenol N-acetyl-beta-D-mannosaminyltransferase